MAIERNLKIYETTNLFGVQLAYGPGSITKLFSISTGSRLSFTLQITAIDPGASVTFKARTGFSQDLPFDEVLVLTRNSIGTAKGVLVDFHNLMEMEVTVAGGTASFAVGVTVADNALATRVDIQNAEIEVQIDHQTDGFGRHSSTRIGDGVEEWQINAEGEGTTHDKTTHELLTKQLITSLLANANFLKLGNFDQVVPTYEPSKITFNYFEDGANIARATMTYASLTDWSIALETFLNDDDGEILEDDNGNPLHLE